MEGIRESSVDFIQLGDQKIKLKNSFRWLKVRKETSGTMLIKHEDLKDLKKKTPVWTELSTEFADALWCWSFMVCQGKTWKADTKTLQWTLENIGGVIVFEQTGKIVWQESRNEKDRKNILWTKKHKKEMDSWLKNLLNFMWTLKEDWQSWNQHLQLLKRKSRLQLTRFKESNSKLGRNMGQSLVSCNCSAWRKLLMVWSVWQGMRQVTPLQTFRKKPCLHLQHRSRTVCQTGVGWWSDLVTISDPVSWNQAGDAMEVSGNSNKSWNAGITFNWKCCHWHWQMWSMHGTVNRRSTEISDVMFRQLTLVRQPLKNCQHHFHRCHHLPSASGISYQEIFASIATLNKNGCTHSWSIHQNQFSNLCNEWILVMDGQRQWHFRTNGEAWKSTNYSSVELQKLMGRKEGVLAVLSIASENGKLAVKTLTRSHIQWDAEQSFEEMEKSILSSWKAESHSWKQAGHTLGRGSWKCWKAGWLLSTTFHHGFRRWWRWWCTFERGGKCCHKNTTKPKFTEQRDLGIVQWELLVK